MPEASPLTRAVTDQLRSLLDGSPDPRKLEQGLRLLAKWRSQILANTLRSREGHVIGHGPFAGMIYDTAASEGGYIPRRLGIYEASLAPVIESIVARAYPLIADIGAAEGYYAIGLARRLPQSRIVAADSNPAAQALCSALAVANGVTNIEVRGTLDHEGLDALAPDLVICDIEGGEDALLDLAACPALARADILVEVHEAMVPGLTARFGPSHRVTRIDRTLDPDALPVWSETLSDLDRLLMLWEWRAGPTPWLWMQALTKR